MAVPSGLVAGPIYLDYNATTPVDPAVVDAVSPYLSEAFGNPSSEHHYGGEPRAALDRARAQVAALIGTSGERIVFTGSGSEANALAVHGVTLAAGIDRPHVITQRTEHPSVLESCRMLRSRYGVDVTWLPVRGDGTVDPDELAAAFTPRTVLVSVMAANNETGALQPIAELARITHEHDAVFHCDAAQAVGKLSIEVTALDVDLLTVVGHKMYAPKGVGALYVRPGVRLEPLVCGGGQERGLRAGTENVAFAVALGTAARLAGADLEAGVLDRVRTLRDRLHERLRAELGDRVRLNGPLEARLPNTLNVSIDGVRGWELLHATPEVAASTGSACHSGRHGPSPVLTAMGLPVERSLSALRLSLGRWSTEEEVDRAAELITATAVSGRSERRREVHWV
ncbi:cysteine desulfurase family protein [Saccharomonospora glauca]|uniref:Cysteine desulfurase family protein n=1 Tax=Saccharomonospora glauca K62 TaxID=928724 RepID=I1D5Q2_9PSEU|nr:cysteine desulfurase family protein [Saccharomonospora glauca]EIF00277.1 cysteine desulfurase family protein [Saccharomonospora glauca K62]